MDVTLARHPIARGAPADERPSPGRAVVPQPAGARGFVHLPAEAPWLAEYLHELTSFPHGKYDDQVDSTAQALDWRKQPMRCAGIYEYYRLLAEERKRQAARVAQMGSLAWENVAAPGQFSIPIP
jgi:hypothetical protein